MLRQINIVNDLIKKKENIMKKLHILALSMLLTTSAVIMNAAAPDENEMGNISHETASNFSGGRLQALRDMAGNLTPEQQERLAELEQMSPTERRDALRSRLAGSPGDSPADVVAIQSRHEDNYDAEHGLNKKRNDNTYDGSKDACEGQYLFVDDNYDTYDEVHHLNKKRNSETHPICTQVCAEKVETIAHPVCAESCSKTLEIVTQAPATDAAKAAERAQIKEEIGEIKAEIREDIAAMKEEAQPAQVKVQSSAGA